MPDEEEEEENHLYDDITEYHRACDMDHEKNGYESGFFFYVPSWDPLVNMSYVLIAV